MIYFINREHEKNHQKFIQKAKYKIVKYIQIKIRYFTQYFIINILCMKKSDKMFHPLTPGDA